MIEQIADLQTVDKIINKLGQLPSAPAILDKAIKLTSNLDSNISEISKSISADQSLSVKVIKMSNSPMFGRLNKITSLNEAINVLGFNQVKSIIISATTFSIFKTGAHAKIADLLWQHSLATALGSRIIAQRYREIDKEEAYLCGLLHDIGKLVLLQTAPNVFEKIIEQIKESDKTFLEVEKTVLGFDHKDIGKALLEKWKFPPHLIKEMTNHHIAVTSEPESRVSIGRITAVANAMANYIGASFFEAYTYSEGDIIYIGEQEIEIDDYIATRLQVEETYHREINSYYE